VSFHFFRSKLILHLNIGINQISDPSKIVKDYARFSGKMIEIADLDRNEIPPGRYIFNY
jgi:hypothetical protein